MERIFQWSYTGQLNFLQLTSRERHRNAIFTVSTLYSLLFEEDICDCRNVSVKPPPCVFVPFIRKALHFFGKRFLFLFIFLLLFCPSWSCTTIRSINRFTSICKNLFNLLKFITEVFRLHVHHSHYLTVSVELAAMFHFMVVVIAEMLVWLVCLIVSKSVWVL